MRQLRLVALRALAEARGLQGVVGPALGRARFGMSSFWIRHRSSSVFSVPGSGFLIPGSRRLVLHFQFPKSRKARIFPVSLARTRLPIQIRAADHAQPLAALAAQRLHRERQVELLPYQMAEV